MERPAVEEFIRLTSVPARYWGMADVDVVELCNYILHLEARLEYAYRAVNFGFEYGSFDFSVLRKEAAAYFPENAA